MLKIKEAQMKKVAYGLVGLAGGTLAMKAIEKALGTQTVSGLLGLEGTLTMQTIAPPIVVGVLGAGYYSANSSKDAGFIGLGAAMAAGAKAIEKVANKTIFSGLDATDYEEIEYVEDYTPATYSGAALDELEGVPVDDIL
jgi:hypothetical protein